MLGPLPLLYKCLVFVTAVAICATGGAWAAFTLPYPVLIATGASLGTVIGGMFAFVLLHESGQVPPAQSARVRRTRPG